LAATRPLWTKRFRALGQIKVEQEVILLGPVAARVPLKIKLIAMPGLPYDLGPSTEFRVYPPVHSPGPNDP
jgi:hypothetical protein